MTAFFRLCKVVVQHRWLIFELVKREVKVRYRGTWLGFLWSVLNPLIMTAIYTLVCTYFLRVGIEKFPAFLFCALLPWNWFNEAVQGGTSCLVNRPGFVRDVIFPSEILPVTTVAAAMVNYILSLPVLAVILIIYHVPVGWSLSVLPIIMVVQFLFTLGIIYFLATITVFFRDLNYIVGLALMAAFFLTPIMYDYSMIPSKFDTFMKLNPLAHIMNVYRAIFFLRGWPYWDTVIDIFILSIVLIILGSWFFESRKESFAEYL